MTKDTVRVLCQYHLAYSPDNTKMLRYISAYSEDKREMAILLGMADREKADSIKDVNEIESVPVPAISRVVENKESNRLETAPFPTVIGLLIEDPAMQQIPKDAIVK